MEQVRYRAYILGASGIVDAPGQVRARPRAAQIHAHGPHAMSHELIREPLHHRGAMATAQAVYEQNNRRARVPRRRRGLMGRQRIAVSEGNDVHLDGHAQRRAFPQVAEDCLDVGVAEKREGTEGHIGGFQQVRCASGRSSVALYLIEWSL